MAPDNLSDEPPPIIGDCSFMVQPVLLIFLLARLYICKIIHEDDYIQGPYPITRIQYVLVI